MTNYEQLLLFAKRAARNPHSTVHLVDLHRLLAKTQGYSTIPVDAWNACIELARIISGFQYAQAKVEKLR